MKTGWINESSTSDAQEKKKNFKNITGKGENAGNQYFPIPTLFSTL